MTCTVEAANTGQVYLQDIVITEAAGDSCTIAGPFNPSRMTTGKTGQCFIHKYVSQDDLNTYELDPSVDANKVTLTISGAANAAAAGVVLSAPVVSVAAHQGLTLSRHLAVSGSASPNTAYLAGG